MSQDIRERIQPMLGQIESIANIYKDLSPWKSFKEMEKAAARILPPGVGYDAIFEKEGIRHIFFEISNPQNAIIL